MTPPECSRSRISRRRALGSIGAIALVPLAPAVSTVAEAQTAPTIPPLARPARILRLRAEKFRQKLGEVDQAESTMFRLVEIAANGQTQGSGFPVLRGREGEPFALEIENALDQATSFHLRGLRGPNAHDGVAGLTSAPLAPGATITIPIAATQTGTFILSPVLADHASEQNARGLQAAVLVEEKNPPHFDHDLVLAVGDWRLDENGVLAEDFLARRDAARLGRLGNKLAANAAPAPGAMRVRPGARLRVRLINVSNARMIPLLVSGFAAEVYAIDSTPCQPFDPLKRTVVLAPASRIEMVLQAPPEAGQKGGIEAKLGQGVAIFNYLTEGLPVPRQGKLAALPDPGLPPAIRLQDAVRVELTIAGGAGRDAADSDPAALEKRFPDPRRIYALTGGLTGKEAFGGFSGKPLASVKRGRVLVLALSNRTAWPQVIALHGHAFRLLHPFDDGWEPYFLDTLYLVPNTTARIALIADNPGKWAIRSTIAEHLAGGVATWFEVT